MDSYLLFFFAEQAFEAQAGRIHGVLFRAVIDQKPGSIAQIHIVLQHQVDQCSTGVVAVQ